LNYLEYITKIEYLLLIIIYSSIAFRMFKLMVKSNNGIRKLKKSLFFLSFSSVVTFSIVYLSLIMEFYKYQTITGFICLVGVLFIYDELC